MKKRKFLIRTLVLIETLSMVFGTACGDTSEPDNLNQGLEPTLTFSAELNETFFKPLIFEGYTYTVQDKNGNPVVLSGEEYLCTEIGDYTIVVTKDGQTQTFPLYVRDTQKPLFDRQLNEEISRGVGDKVDLDTLFKVTDNSGNVSMSYEIERNAIEKVTAEEDGTIVLQYGFYNVKAIAKDPSGNTSEQSLYIHSAETVSLSAQEVLNSSIGRTRTSVYGEFQETSDMI